MQVVFNPKDPNTFASASLDKTVKVWSIGASVPNFTLEGHEKGVNWVSFHPTMKILASAADDKTIKLWRLSGNKHWEMDTLKGHTNNISCVMFHPRMEILISNSEDRTMRFWDMNRRV